MSDFDEAIMAEFMAESKEHLENIEGELLDLEKNEEGVDLEKINEIFRAIHSIKGASGFLGLTKIGALSHVMETLLSMMRSGEVSPEHESVDGLLKGVDCLNTMFDDLDNSNEMDIEELHLLISSFIKGSSSLESEKEITLIESSEGQEIDFKIDALFIKNMGRQHDCLYVLEYDLVQLAQENKSPVALLKELDGLGEIIETRSIHTEIDLKTGDLASPMVTKVLFSSVLDYEMMLEAACLEKEKIVEVNLKKTVVEEAEVAVDLKGSSTNQKKYESIEKKRISVEQVSSEAIRINVHVLDRLMTLAGEMVLVRNQCMQAVENNCYDDMGIISQHLNVVTAEMQETIMLTRMQPIGNVFGKLPRIVRDLSKKLEKNIEINTIGNEVEIDKTILQALADPLTHLVRNCCDHAIETPAERIHAGKSDTGIVTIHAYHEAGQVNIKVQDDGKGLDIESIKNKAIQNNIKTKEEFAQMSEKEVLSLIMLPGFSTAKVVSDVSGRGVGMDVVKSSIEKLGGEIELISSVGIGTTVHMRLPLTLAIIPSLIVGVDDQRYAIPQVSLEELVSLDQEDMREMECADNQEVFRLRDQLLPIVRLNEVLHRPLAFSAEVNSEILKKYHSGNCIDESKSVVFAVVNVRGKRYGLIIDKVFGTEEIVVKPMHIEMKRHEIYSGSTVMGDGKVALILSIDGIAHHTGVRFNCSQGDATSLLDVEIPMQKSLLFNSGVEEQFALEMSLIKRVEKISAKHIEKAGSKEFITIDNKSMMVIRLDRVLDVSSCLEADDLFLLIPKNVAQPCGILMSRVLDIVDVPKELNTESYQEDGLFGTSIIRDKMTLVLDIDYLVDNTKVGKKDKILNLNTVRA